MGGGGGGPDGTSPARHLLPWPGDLKGRCRRWGWGDKGQLCQAPHCSHSLEVAAACPLSMFVSSPPPPPCQLASQQREVSEENKAVGWQLSQRGLCSPHEAHRAPNTLPSVLSPPPDSSWDLARSVEDTSLLPWSSLTPCQVPGLMDSGLIG